MANDPNCDTSEPPFDVRGFTWRKGGSLQKDSLVTEHTACGEQKNMPQHLFPAFKLPDFLLPVLDLGGQFLTGFSLGFVMGGRSFLLMGKRKEQPFSWWKIAALGGCI